jgi:hypothetical protein
MYCIYKCCKRCAWSPCNAAKWQIFLLEQRKFKKYKSSLEQNVHIHSYNTRRKLDLHIQFCNTVLFRGSVLNMGIRLYNKVPDHLNNDNFKTFRRKIKSLLLHHALYSEDEFISFWAYMDSKSLRVLSLAILIHFHWC